MFPAIKDQFARVYAAIAAPLARIFTKKCLEAADIDQIEELLLRADVGLTMTNSLVAALRAHGGNHAVTGVGARELLVEKLVYKLGSENFSGLRDVVLFVGINGSGKTTALAKLAYLQCALGKKVLICAADTFRAAATDQLNVWAQRVGCDIVTGQQGADPSSIIYRACQQFVVQKYDNLFIDTAGRLQTKTHLMLELAKMRRIIDKIIDSQRVSTLLTLDAMLGQNSFEQAKLFRESTGIDGVVITKLDGAGKAGIVCAIVSQLHIPIAYTSFGESLESLSPFKVHDYVQHLVGA